MINVLLFKAKISQNVVDINGASEEISQHVFGVSKIESTLEREMKCTLEADCKII